MDVLISSLGFKGMSYLKVWTNLMWKTCLCVQYCVYHKTTPVDNMLSPTETAKAFRSSSIEGLKSSVGFVLSMNHFQPGGDFFFMRVCLSITALSARGALQGL